ncbi:hypothetical protein [Pelagerythrobacter marensis]|uniref:hypothetical protein n=1 Tax=Pelagerythrobacter marensis TaxID=543877 RepID=UPI0012378C70|nr:hypothetical protein [Pelagerythrobacter marensis]
MIFLIAGALIGWLAAIVGRIEDGPRIAVNLVAGGIGAAIFGTFANRGSVLSGASAISIPAAAGGALIAIVIVALLRNQSFRK